MIRLLTLEKLIKKNDSIQDQAGISKVYFAWYWIGHAEYVYFAAGIFAGTRTGRVSHSAWHLLQVQNAFEIGFALSC